MAFWGASRTMLLTGVITMLVSGCLAIPATENPLPSMESVNGNVRNETLVVMLPGRGDRADAFFREGFQEAGARFGFDTVAVDAHLGYYVQRELLERLHDDIIVPAREAGYRNVWLLGISMGGLGSLLYTAEWPEQVDGIVLLAPYLGERSAIREIVASESLQNWNPEDSTMEDYEITVWTWIRDRDVGSTDTPLVLAYGLSDRMAGAYDELAPLIRPTAVYTREGGHKWTTWRPLWDQISAGLDF